MEIEMKTNIKNLPEGLTYFTENGYSQSYPWVEIDRTPKTVTLAKVEVSRDPEWKPSITPGGFCGHCDNQHEQTWLFKRIVPGWTKTVRITKRGWAHKGVRFDEGCAIEFYDYNF
jgi:hypothetical protein